MRKKHPLDYIFPKTRQALLAAVLPDPERSWYVSDLARHLRVRPSSLQREIAGLVDAGILRRNKQGNRVYIQADPECPFFGELRSLVLKTVGLRDVLQRLLRPFSAEISVAFIYGSIARGEDTSASDIDLMVIGRLGLSDLAVPLRKAEAALGRPVNPSVFAPAEIAKKLAAGHHFVTSVLAADKLFILRGPHELAEITGEQPRAKPQRASRNLIRCALS